MSSSTDYSLNEQIYENGNKQFVFLKQENSVQLNIQQLKYTTKNFTKINIFMNII